MNIHETQNYIFQRISQRLKAFRDVHVVAQTASCLVLGASCLELGPQSLGSLLVNHIQSLVLKRRPSSVGYSTQRVRVVPDRNHPLKYSEFHCDRGEVLIICDWYDAPTYARVNSNNPRHEGDKRKDSMVLRPNPDALKFLDKTVICNKTDGTSEGVGCSMGVMEAGLTGLSQKRRKAVEKF